MNGLITSYTERDNYFCIMNGLIISYFRFILGEKRKAYGKIWIALQYVSKINGLFFSDEYFFFI